MPIQSGDIKIFKSDDMSDFNSGGGEITQVEVISGTSNNVFNDVSELDRTIGAVHLRKLFPSVFTQSLDYYFGAHTILSKIPKDDKVQMLLFTTNDWHDRRDNATNRIESYRARADLYQGFLYNTQWTGSSIIKLFQNPLAPIPDIAEVLYITQLNDSQNQYIKVVDVTSEVQDFVVNLRSFRRRIVTLEISEPLKYDFVGHAIAESDAITPQAQMYNTIVADAAKFYSTRPLNEAITLGQTFAKADTVYGQLVPSTIQETAMILVNPSGDIAGAVNKNGTSVTFTTSTNFDPNKKLYLGNPVKPGTLSIDIGGGATLTDNGGSVLDNGTIVGSIDYLESNIIFAPTSPTYTGLKTINFEIAIPTIVLADTGIIKINDGNRGNIYTETIRPAPTIGSVRVHFRVLDTWYDLIDNSGGGLVAQGDNIGSGSITYNGTVSAVVSISLINQPDVGSAILFEWGVDITAG